MMHRMIRGILAAVLVLAGTITDVAAGGVSPVPLGSLPIDQAFGATVGGMLCRTSSGWAVVAAGSAAQVLTVPSGGGCPAWATPASGGNLSNTGTPTAGQIAFFTNATTVQGMSLLPISAGGTGASTASANLVFAGPTSGSAASPIFRSLVPADVPAAADGCIRMSVQSTTVIALNPYGCNTLSIGGVPRIVTATTLTPSSPAASTLYYVYASWSGTAVTYATSTTGHLTDANGRECINASGSANCASRLVGMLYANASGQFVDSLTWRGCLNWFKASQRGLAASQDINGGGTASTTPVTALGQTVTVLAWADEAVTVTTSGYSTTNTAAVGAFTVNMIDAGRGPGNPSVSTPYTSGSQGAAAITNTVLLSEGPHTIGVGIYVGSSSGTGSWYVSQSIATRG